VATFIVQRVAAWAFFGAGTIALQPSVEAPVVQPIEPWLGDAQGKAFDEHASDRAPG
jgi:hypothetical protein